MDNRNIYFGPAGRYYYFIDERFSYNNNHYSSSDNRYSPLSPDAVDPAGSAPPILTLNGKSDYIALIIDAGTDGLDAVNRDRNPDFVSNVNPLNTSDSLDKIVGITYEEWRNQIAARVCVERLRFLGLDTTYTSIGFFDAHWFNNYVAGENPLGSDWRSWSYNKCPQ
jgi:hypothetical protein